MLLLGAGGALPLKQAKRAFLNLLLVVVASGSCGCASAEAQDLMSLTGELGAHGMPLPQRAKTQAALTAAQTSDTPALSYHGGPVMTSATTYAIFWVPSKLQDGQSTSLPQSYQNVQTAFLKAYPGHGIDNNNTQYYMTTQSGSNTVTHFIESKGSFGGSYVDTSAYPSSGCDDPVTGSNCVSDWQIQQEVQKVMDIKGWTGGLNHIFFVYTSIGEGSCSGSWCSYTKFCAYHSYFNNGETPVFYANMPYAGLFCESGSSPNGDLAADSAASITSHELTETITDPELNAWYSSNGEEIADLCAWNYGENTWENANQYWPITFNSRQVSKDQAITSFEIQQEYDNHTASCTQLGP